MKCTPRPNQKAGDFIKGMVSNSFLDQFMWDRVQKSEKWGLEQGIIFHETWLKI